MIGCLLIFKENTNYKKVISNSLLFSSSVMLYISIFNLIPASFSYINKIYEFIPSMSIISIYVLLGGILVYVIDIKSKKENKLYKIGIISMIVLVIHNIPEGVITFLTTSKDISIGLSLAISITLHNIPEGISIAIPIYYGEKSKKKAIICALIAALSEPFGALLCFLFFRNINNYLFSIILSFTSGIMIYLSIFELLKEGIKYKEKNIIYYLLGFIIMILSILII